MTETAVLDAKPVVATDQVTLDQLFLRNCRQWGDKVAMRHKRYGIWNEYTWRRCYDEVRAIALGLLSLGLESSDKVALIGDLEPDLYWAMFAVWADGAATVGCHVDLLAEELRYILDHSDSTFAVARDQEQVDKFLRIKDDVPKVKRVVWRDPQGMRHYTDPWLISLREVSGMGREYLASHPTAFEESIARTRPDDLATMFYTSGTTGQPKGCCHTHRSIINYADTAAGKVLGATADDDTVPYFSLGTIGEPMLGSAAHLLIGLRMNIPEEPTTTAADLREIAPSFIGSIPRYWEGIASTIQVNVGEADFLKRFCYEQFLKVGYRSAEFRYKGQRPNLLWRALHWLGEQLVFRPVRDRVGLSKLKRGTTTSYALGVETLKLLGALGVDLRQFYGSTEQGLVAAQLDDDIRPESVGVILPGNDVKISPEGELLTKTPQLFSGYYKNPEASEVALREGWFHTGDAGYFDEHRNIFLYGRLSEMRELAHGAKYAPQFVEAQLRFGAHVRDAVAFGGKDDDYVTALITLDFQAAAMWAENNRLVYTTSLDLSQKDQLAERVLRDIKRVNKALPKEARIRKFVILHKEFDPDEGELTRTRKVKRTLVETRYADMIAAMYTGQSEVLVSALVTYQDGRTRTVTASLKVRVVPDED